MEEEEKPLEIGKSEIEEIGMLSRVEIDISAPFDFGIQVVSMFGAPGFWKPLNSSNSISQLLIIIWLCIWIVQGYAALVVESLFFAGTVRLMILNNWFKDLPDGDFTCRLDIQ